MTKSNILFFILAATFVLSCTVKSYEKEYKPLLTMPVKADIVGAITDGTTMNTLQVVDANGDTTTFEIGNERFFGTNKVGDSVTVSYIPIADELVSSTSINMKSLQHTWALDNTEDGNKQYLEIDPQGFAHLYINKKETNKYQRWIINDGILILIPPADSVKTVKNDTLEITALTDDTLTVNKDGKELKYWRYN